MKEMEMLEGKRAVLFDLDGTLVDSMWIWGSIDNEYLRRFQLEVPEGLHEKIEGMSFTQTALYFKQYFGISDSVERIIDEWNEMAYEKYVKEVPLKEGTRELLEELKRRRIKMGIATSNSKHLVQTILKTHDLSDSFDSVITSCEMNKGKPEPDIYLESARRLCVKAKECLVFEDVPMGILAGKRAGMEVCAVADPFSEYQLKKKREYADYYIHDFHEVLDNRYEVLKSE